MERHKWLLACLCLAMALSGTALAATQTITVWVGDGAIRLEEYQWVARQFEAKHPGVKVEVLGQAGYQPQVMEKITLAIASGAPPDATWIEGSAVMELAIKGLLLDVSRAVEGLTFTPADTQEMTYNGKMWAVPYHTSVRGLFKRADHFQEAGMNPNIDPTSLDEMYAWSKKLTKTNSDGVITRAGMVPWEGNWGPPGWIWTFGGRMIEIDGPNIRPTANERRNVEAFTWLRDFALIYGSRTPVTAGTTGLANGTVSMSTESTSTIGTLNAAGVAYTTGRVPNPPGGQNGTWGGGTAIGVPLGAPNPTLAMQLVRFFGEANVQVERYRAKPTVLPANWQGLLTVGRTLSKEWGPLLDQFPEARARTPLWIEYYLNQLLPAMNAVVAGTKTPEQALEEVQTIMEERFKDLYANK